MAARSSARYVAPVALAACTVAVLMIASSGGGGGGGEDFAPAPVSRQRTRPARTPRRPRTYLVRAGDVLSVIAERTGVSLDRIVALNPGVDSQTLHPGQELRLSP